MVNPAKDCRDSAHPIHTLAQSDSVGLKQKGVVLFIFVGKTGGSPFFDKYYLISDNISSEPEK